MGSDNGPSGFRRRDLLRSVGVGGAILSFTGIGTQTALAEENDSKEIISGDQLKNLSTRVYKHKDVQNVLTNEFPNFPVEFVDASNVDDDSELSQDEVSVSAAHHYSEQGPNILQLGFSADENSVIQFTKYSRSVDKGVITRARRFNVVGDEFLESTLELSSTSINGELPKDPSNFPQATSCPGCDTGGGPGSSGYYLDETETCTAVNVQCAMQWCGACQGLCSTPPSCLTCLIAFCGVGIAACCSNWEESEECFACGGTP